MRQYNIESSKFSFFCHKTWVVILFFPYIFAFNYAFDRMDESLRRNEAKNRFIKKESVTRTLFFTSKKQFFFSGTHIFTSNISAISANFFFFLIDPTRMKKGSPSSKVSQLASKILIRTREIEGWNWSFNRRPNRVFKILIAPLLILHSLHIRRLHGIAAL